MTDKHLYNKTFSLKNHDSSSHKYGPCEVCDAHVADVFSLTTNEVVFSKSKEREIEVPRSLLFGHKKCLSYQTGLEEKPSFELMEACAKYLIQLIYGGKLSFEESREMSDLINCIVHSEGIKHKSDYNYLLKHMNCRTLTPYPLIKSWMLAEVNKIETLGSFK